VQRLRERTEKVEKKKEELRKQGKEIYEKFKHGEKLTGDELRILQESDLL